MQEQCKQNILYFWFSLKYIEITTVKNSKIFLKPFKKKKLAITLFHYVSRDIWLGSSKELIWIDLSRLLILSRPQGRFGNLGIGTSASVLAPSLQKFYLYLTHFFLEKIAYHAQYASIFFLVQLVLSYLKIFALLECSFFLLLKHACWEKVLIYVWNNLLGFFKLTWCRHLKIVQMFT